MPIKTDYTDVTELSGDDVTQEQIDRICQRYYWAGRYCRGKDVLEVACGSGQGLGYLNSLAKSFEGGDFSYKMIDIAKAHYGGGIKFSQFDAQNMPFKIQSKDVIILFEALYYLPDPVRFISECSRVLRSRGSVLICTANKDLYDFNPSLYSYSYYGSVELTNLFEAQGFKVRLFGGTPISTVSYKQKLLRPIKKAAVNFGIMPRSMASKKLIKRFVFGKMVTMPAEIEENTSDYNPPIPITNEYPDTIHKVIFCEATKI
jgi:ubiquinone/menaquinone biosynthesis C-methylase UbiE